MDIDKHNQTYVMLKTLESWLDSLASDPAPFFLYVHCPNPHLPYTPPQKWIDSFTDDITLSPREALQLSLDTYADRDQMIGSIANGCQFTGDEWAALRAMYDAEIAYADEFVGSLFDRVRELDTGNTIFVVTGDHGDLFGERGLLGHNLVLHDHLTNVPLIIHGLEGVERASDSMVQHVDITRTIAEALGVTDKQFSGVDLRNGGLEYAISQRGFAHFDEYLNANPSFDTSQFHSQPTTALRSDSFKFVRSEDKSALYELPDEDTDTSDEYPVVRDRFNTRLDEALNSMTFRDESGRGAEYTDAMEQQLSDLGYK